MTDFAEVPNDEQTQAAPEAAIDDAVVDAPVSPAPDATAVAPIDDSSESDVVGEDALLGVDDDDEDEDDFVPVESPYDRPGSWYVVHSYAGYENKVKSNLESRIASMNMEDR